jgi:hypothetical protein
MIRNKPSQVNDRFLLTDILSEKPDCTVFKCSFLPPEQEETNSETTSEGSQAEAPGSKDAESLDPAQAYVLKAFPPEKSLLNEWLANVFLKKFPHENVASVLEMGKGEGALEFEGRTIYTTFVYILMPCYEDKDLHDQVADRQHLETP